jgi:hypothetical protein
MSPRPASGAATVGKHYRARIAVAGGKDPHWNVSAGKLPAGIKLNASTGMLQGVPRHAGRFGFTVSVADALGARVSVRYTLRVGT